MEHYVPLHLQLVKFLKLLLDGRADDELMFHYHSMYMWIKGKKYHFRVLQVSLC